uniref:non-specific serine/threonine protein kinase n=1 Tax=Electrophorus electricus TaxID=8005 RepID=A0AAY5F0L7_ELEEL
SAFLFQPGKSWIQTTFYKRECVKFLPVSWVDHRCCCGRLIGEHVELDSMSRGRGPAPPMSSPPSGDREDWSVTKHTKASSTDAFGSIDFQGSTKRTCRAKYVRLSCDAKPEQLLCLMLREWNLAPPKLVISIHGGLENFPLPQRVGQAFSKGLIRAAETTGAWILTDGFNTGVSMYVGDAVKLYGTHERRKRNVIGVTPWGLVENHRDLIGQDVLRHYHTLGNPLSKRSSLNCLHSHFLLVDDGTLGKSGGQLELRRRLERHLHRQRIHPRLGQRVPVVCVVVEGGPPVLSLVLEYVSRTPPVPVIVFEGTGRAADLLALIHKQTALDTDIKEDFLLRVQAVFGVGRPEASQLFTVLTSCMGHREMVSNGISECIFVTLYFILLPGTPADQLSITLAWDRADIAQEHILVYGQQWKVGALEQAMLNALLMDRVGFVKLLIENGITLKHFLTVSRLEELYNTVTHIQYCNCTSVCLQCRLSVGHKISLIDIGMAIEYLIGGAYRSTYMRKSFRAVYNQIHSALKVCSSPLQSTASTTSLKSSCIKSALEQSKHQTTQPPFFRTAEPYRRKLASPAELGGTSLFVYSINDLFVWAVLMRRQQMALFLWQHGEQAMARAVVACRLYRAMATEAKERIMGDSIAEELKKFSIEFGQLAVDLLDKAFKENECMAMKLLTSEMTDWSNFTCLQMAVASGLRPFVAHSCTQMLLTDLWMGHLNMRKNSWVKIIVSILLPMAIQLLEFKSKAEMSHIPQTHEALQFGVEAASSGEQCDAESGRNCAQSRSGLAVRCLPWARKVYDFYNAPVVKFWFHTMSYLAFLMLFSYTVLVRMESRPSAAEWLVIAYIISTAVEKTRELWVSEPRKFRKKLKVWFSEYWNISDFIAIFLFFTGLVLRCQSDPARTAGRLMYCLDIIFWFVRLMDILAINQQAGPYLTMITKMMSNMFYIMIIMGIVLVSFGTPRWSILKPDEEPSWDLLKQVLFQPYFMMFGEVYAGEINPCEADPDCPPGSFLNPLLQAVYLFMQYIIMVNLLIAFYNNVYVHMKTISNKLWKYNRYRYIMTYQEKPWLPPPLILLSHMTLCVSALWHRKRGAAGQERDSGLKLFLAPEDLKKLHEFEEKCVAAYFRDKNESQNSSQLNRIRSASDKAEEMVTTLSEVAEKVQFIQESLQTLDGHLGRLQDLSALAVDTLNLLSATDNRQHEAVLLGNSQPIRRPYQQLSHSWSLRIGGNVMPNQAPLSPKAYRSTPPSLLRGLGLGKKHPSLEWPPGGGAGLWDSQPKWVLGNLDGDDSVFRCRLNGDSYEGSGALLKSTEDLDPHYSGELEHVLLCSSVFFCVLAYSGMFYCLLECSGLFCQSSAQLKAIARYCCGLLLSSAVTRFALLVLAMERNNLMRLAHTIPFTPVSLLGGDEVCVYTLEESDSESTLIGTSSWCQRGQTAVLQPITHQGALDGGLRRALRVVCTWAEGDVLKPGCVYVVKAFRTEVVRTWQREFPNSTSLHLCLREIQQQRAAQKLMQVFNQVKPITVPHSLRLVESSRQPPTWLTIERNMSGDFMKYSNNTGEEIAPSCGLEETVLAFSHWTYEYTCRELLVLDLQGVGMELTDPSVIRVDDKSSSEDLVFGPANLGNDAIHHFILKHTCNSCCGKLGLSGELSGAGSPCIGLQKSNSDSDEDVSMV